MNRGGSGSAASAAAAGGKVGVPQAGRHFQPAQMWQQREVWLARKLEVKDPYCENVTYRLTAQDALEELRRIVVLFALDVQNQFDWKDKKTMIS